MILTPIYYIPLFPTNPPVSHAGNAVQATKNSRLKCTKAATDMMHEENPFEWVALRAQCIGLAVWIRICFAVYSFRHGSGALARLLNKNSR